MSRPAASELPFYDQPDRHLRLVRQRDRYAWPDIEFVGCFQLIAQLMRLTCIECCVQQGSDSDRARRDEITGYEVDQTS